MDNIDRALAVLEASRRPGEIRIHPYDAVEALAKAGLIMTDLPEPSYIVTECDEQSPAWEPCGPEYVVTMFKEPITGRYLIGVDDSPYAVEPQEARELGLAILAAADYQENNNA